MSNEKGDGKCFLKVEKEELKLILKQGKLFYLKDYVFDTSNFPPAMPTGDYRIDIGMTNRADGKSFLKVELYIAISRRPVADIMWN